MKDGTYEIDASSKKISPALWIIKYRGKKFTFEFPTFLYSFFFAFGEEDRDFRCSRSKLQH